MRVQYVRAKRTDVTRTFDVIGPSVCENPTLNSNNNFYPPPPFEAQGTADLLLPVSHASSLRAIAVPPQSGRQSRCLGRGVHVSDGVRCPDHETPPLSCSTPGKTSRRLLTSYSLSDSSSILSISLASAIVFSTAVWLRLVSGAPSEGR